ncbi:MAG TPA: aldo/keto reductase [Candidatus Saccharimonadia bacterium]|nr:aldo/keto reductase [Candidatus Saccharimonadia bacterium]
MNTIELIGQTVPRMGYGTMRLPGQNVWGPPKDHDEAIGVLKRSVELGIRVIDTAWYYGPNVSNELLAEALFPYPDDLIIVTKLGGKRDDAGKWLPANTSDELRRGMELDLRLLKLDVVPVVHLRWMETGSEDDFKAAVGAMMAMQQEGMFKHLGLSNVTQEQLDYTLQQTDVVTVSNAYSVQDRHDDAMVDRCAKDNIVYLPYFPLATGKADSHEVLQKWAKELQVSASQVALAALLARSDSMLPIPGTSSLAHLEENFAALRIELPGEAMKEISDK